jgi:transcription antitermination factor NusG
MNNAQPWFALQTKPRNERKIEHLLVQKRYQCFTPTYRQKRRWSDRTVEIDLPLFPTYVFCRFSSSALGKIISTSGVSKIVGFGGRPAEVAIEEIEALQLLSQSNFLREPWQYLPDGTLVRVETGPLAGVQGAICPYDNKRRLIMSVTLLQRSVAVQLDEDTVVSVIAGSNGSGTGLSSESSMAVSLLRKHGL